MAAGPVFSRRDPASPQFGAQSRLSRFRVIRFGEALAGHVRFGLFARVPRVEGEGLV